MYQSENIKLLFKNIPFNLVNITKSRHIPKSVNIDGSYYYHLEIITRVHLNSVYNLIMTSRSSFSGMIRYSDIMTIFNLDEFDSRKLMYLMLLLSETDGSPIYSISTDMDVTTCRLINDLDSYGPINKKID